MENSIITNIKLQDLDLNLGNGLDVYDGSFYIPATDELIDITNLIREFTGNTDLVGVDYDNDVYYNFYLYFNCNEHKVQINAEVAHGDKDDYVFYNIPLTSEEQRDLLFMIIKELIIEIDK